VPGDLHCHSKISDGSLGLEEIITLAARSGLKYLSITDHDTYAGVQRAVLIGNRMGVNVIPGIELSTFNCKTNKKVHLLAYMCDLPDRLERICKITADARKKAANIMVNRLVKIYKIPPEMIVKRSSGSTNFYKQHISHALMDCGYSTEIYGSLYQKLFGPNGLILAEPEYPDTFEVLEEIKQAYGIAVLAHPPVYRTIEDIDSLVSAGLDGIEVYHTRHTEEQTQLLIGIANKNNLLMTGGSDFHGMYNVVPTRLGQAVSTDEMIMALQSYKKKIAKEKAAV